MSLQNIGAVFFQWYENKYRSAIHKIGKQKDRIKVLKRQKTAYSRQIKRLQRRNTELRRDLADMVYEVCPHCGDEVAIRWDVEYYGYIAHCPVCGGKLMLCSQCDKGLEVCGECGFGYADDSCLQEAER